MKTSRRSVFAPLVGLVLLDTGCGMLPQPGWLRGTVTYQGKPVPAGEISFTPDPPGRGPDIPMVCQIRNGTYQVAFSRAMPDGRYVVKIVGLEAAGPAGLVPNATVSPYTKALFRPYEATVEVTRSVTTYDFEVPVEQR